MSVLTSEVRGVKNNAVVITNVTAVSMAPNHLTLTVFLTNFGTRCCAIAYQVMNEKRLPKIRIKMISTIKMTILIADSAIAKAILVKLDGEAEMSKT